MASGGLVLAIAVSVLAVSGSPPAAATPFNVEIKSQQFNAASLLRGRDSRDLVKFFMLGQGPHTVSLNEICLYDALWIRDQTGYATPAFYEATTSTGCPIVNGRRSWGSAAFVVGTTPRGGYERELPEQDPGDTSKVPSERRGLSCTWAQTFVGRLVSCAAHLTNKDPLVAFTQAEEYVWIAAATPGTAGFDLQVLGGDFNLSPPDQPNVIKDDFHRVFTNFTFSAANLSLTYDYMQVKEPNYTGQLQTPGTNRHCDNGYSDHCYIWGTFY